MGVTKIEWTDYTFNPWIGCAKISPGCDNCYAEAMSKRRKWAVWGANEPRRTMSESYWRAPYRWDREGGRVFCASLADVFDNKAPANQRERLWATVRETPRLEWLLLTKRPQNVVRFLPRDWGDGYDNVRLGVTAENQAESGRRLPRVLDVPSRLRPFVSAEPLLESLDLRPWLADIGQVLTGSESGHCARPMAEDWVRGLRDQCTAAGVPFFYKQRLDGRRKVSLPKLDGQRWTEHALPALESQRVSGA